jgi:hypothetical protein
VIATLRAVLLAIGTVIVGWLGICALCFVVGFGAIWLTGEAFLLFLKAL